MKSTLEKKACEAAERLTGMVDKNKRTAFIKALIGSLEKELKKLRATGEVVTAVSLSKQELQTLEQIMTKRFGKEVKLENKVDKSILGGLIIRYEDLVIDQSVIRQLEGIKQKAI